MKHFYFQVFVSTKEFSGNGFKKFSYRNREGNHTTGDLSEKFISKIFQSNKPQLIVGHDFQRVLGLDSSSADQVDRWSCIGTPLIRNKKTIGAMILISQNHKLQYKRNDLAHFLTIAPQIATAIERKLSHEELKSAEEKFSKAFFSSPAWMIITLLETGEILEVNNAFLKATGYTRHDLIGQKDQDIKLWKNKQDKDKLAAWIIRHKTSKNLEVEMFHKNAETISTLCSGEILTINDQKCLLLAALDLSEIKNLEIQLQQAKKMESIGTLAGGIAHDFNNILFPIIGHTEVLIQDTPEDSPFRSNLDEIYTGAMRAKDLVQQMLTFSRQESLELTRIKIQPIIEEALKFIRSSIPTTIAIKKNINANRSIIKADPTQIHQIIMNLTTNAYHAMQETGGELKVSLKEIEISVYDLKPDIVPGIYVCLTVADTGIGMHKNLIQKIFDPFFTTKEQGTGMGLSVVHGIVKSIDGAIQVNSKPDKGTEFNVYFPLEKSDFDRPIVQTKEQIQGGSEQILIVDDDKSVIIIERQLLECLGYQVTSFHSSIEALEVFRSAPDKFNLVITDMTMPNMTGDILSAELRKIRSDIPILLCTGYGEIMSNERAASVGINGFLMKPIVIKKFSQKIREVLDKNNVGVAS